MNVDDEHQLLELLMRHASTQATPATTRVPSCIVGTHQAPLQFSLRLLVITEFD